MFLAHLLQPVEVIGVMIKRVVGGKREHRSVGMQNVLKQPEIFGRCNFERFPRSARPIPLWPPPLRRRSLVKQVPRYGMSNIEYPPWRFPWLGVESKLMAEIFNQAHCS